jgi:DNA primase
MKAEWVDFRAIKHAVSMEMVLAMYGIMLHRVDRNYVRGRCPLPTHRSKSSTQSFIVNTEKNAWACHSDSCTSARGGHLGGNVLDFVSWMENCSIRDAALRLQDWLGLKTVPTRRAMPASIAFESDWAPSQETVPALPFTLKGIDSSHPYLANRNVKPDTAAQFGIGFFPGKGYMEGRLVIPIHNEEGVLVAYAGRSLGGGEPKYRFPPRFRKSLLLFNLHRAIRCGKSVVVVEGFFDCFNVHQADMPCVVALMGCSLSQRQEQLLQAHFHEVVLFLDGDKAGRNAATTIATRLVPKVSTRIVEVPSGSQPDRLTADQIRCLCIPGYF